MDRTHEISSGNVFADLGLPNSEQELVKAKLTVQIYQILGDWKPTQLPEIHLSGYDRVYAVDRLLILFEMAH